MITLRQRQKAAFEPLRQEALLLAVIRFLRAHPAHEIQGLDDDRLRAAARAGIAESRTFGLTWQSSIGAFAGLTILLGLRFHEHPAVRAVLEDDRMPVDERVFALRAWLTPEQWREAKRTADGSGGSFDE